MTTIAMTATAATIMPMIAPVESPLFPDGAGAEVVGAEVLGGSVLGGSV